MIMDIGHGKQLNHFAELGIKKLDLGWGITLMNHVQLPESFDGFRFVIEQIGGGKREEGVIKIFRHLFDAAKINNPQFTFGGDQEIAGMRIGMYSAKLMLL